METHFVASEDVKVKLRSKQDLYSMLCVDSKSPPLHSLVGYFLPSIDKCPISFMRDILRGKKKVSSDSLTLLFRL